WLIAMLTSRSEPKSDRHATPRPELRLEVRATQLREHDPKRLLEVYRARRQRLCSRPQTPFGRLQHPHLCRTQARIQPCLRAEPAVLGNRPGSAGQPIAE